MFQLNLHTREECVEDEQSSNKSDSPGRLTRWRVCAQRAAEEFLFRSTIIGSNPNTVIGGVPSGGAPWTVHRGAAALTGDGRLRVEIAGLILVNLGTPGPVKSVSGSLVCGDTGGSVVATTDAVPLFPEGDAEVESRVNFNDTPGPWIAGTGFTNAAEPNSEGHN